jgi:hypothetical protein
MNNSMKLLVLTYFLGAAHAFAPAISPKVVTVCRLSTDDMKQSIKPDELNLAVSAEGTICIFTSPRQGYFCVIEIFNISFLALTRGATQLQS